ncbi:MAG: hypothetical protein ACRETZ_15675 [Steroidobacteraceae bacterium]
MSVPLPQSGNAQACRGRSRHNYFVQVDNMNPGAALQAQMGGLM